MEKENTDIIRSEIFNQTPRSPLKLTEFENFCFRIVLSSLDESFQGEKREPKNTHKKNNHIFWIFLVVYSNFTTGQK